MNRNKIMAIGLNPALQKLLFFKCLKPGEVNRAENISYISGGKAANFAKAAENFGTETVIYQFSGGDSGERYRKILKEEGLQFVNQLTKSETRTCSTLMGDKTIPATELIEPSGDISEDEAKSLLAYIVKDIPSYKGVALCGTYPPGIKEKFYTKIASQAVKQNIPLLLDACTNIEDVMKTGVEILKINLDELKSVSGKRKVATAARRIFSDFNVKIIAVTDGSGSAHIFVPKFKANPKKDINHFEFTIPKFRNIINPIGAGDTVSAVLLSEYIAGKSITEAFRTALGAGTASCMKKENAVYNLKKALKISKQIIIKQAE